MQLSGDGRWLATASEEGKVWLWEMTSGKRRGPLMHETRVNSVHINSDNSRLITATEGGTVQVWDATTLKPRGAPIQLKRPVRYAQFSADGSRLLTATVDPRMPVKLTWRPQ